MGPTLFMENISKSFAGKYAVDGLNLSVGKGEVYGFLGPNGAGKTTSIRMMMGLVDPDTGTLSILGYPKARDANTRIGYLPEERGIYQNMNPVSFMTYLATLKGMNAAHARKKALLLLEKYGLGDVAHKKIKTFSKGMSQKVQVLASVIHDPELIVFDEPFSGLDPVNQAILEELIGDLKAKGTTVLFSTHVMQHAERLCDRLHVLAKGKTRFIGTINEAQALLPTRIDIQVNKPPSQEQMAGHAYEVTQLGGNCFKMTFILNGARVDEILRACLNANITLEDVAIHRPSLHDVFIHLAQDGSQAQ